MCSSAVVAVHEACEYLRNQGGALAIAGAVNLYLHPLNFAALSRSRMISSERRARIFEKTSGYDGNRP